MAKERREPTFAEIAANARAQPSSRMPLRPGGFNLDGEFASPSGVLLTRTSASITPSQAQADRLAGALVAYEGCGCGGGLGGCPTEWIDAARFAGAPRPTLPRRDEWARIERWEGDGVTVVFVHGGVVWGDAIP